MDNQKETHTNSQKDASNTAPNHMSPPVETASLAAQPPATAVSDTDTPLGSAVPASTDTVVDPTIEKTLQSTMSVKPVKRTKPAKTPLVLAGVAFALLSIALFVIGPGLFLYALQLDGYGWVLSFFYEYFVAGVGAVSIVSAVLYLVSFIMAYKKSPHHLANILIMLSGNIIGLALMWLSGYNLIRVSSVLAAIILMLCILCPVIGLVLLHINRAKCQKNIKQMSGTGQVELNLLPKEQGTPPSIRILTAVSLVILVVEAGVAVVYFVQNGLAYAKFMQERREFEAQEQQEIDAIASRTDLDGGSQIANLAYAICLRENFEVVYQLENKAIVQCTESQEIYELGDQIEEDDDGYYTKAQAVYYGTTKDEEVERYFPGQKYIFRDLQNASYPDEVTLLLPASSAEEVIANYSEPLYNYIQALNAQYDTDLQLRIFFNEDLSDVETTQDFVILAGIHEVPGGWLPHGNGLSSGLREYIFEDPDELAILNYFGENPEDTYSAQTRSAIKFHPHFNFSINGGEDLTLEELQELMRDSLLCQNSDLGWESCSG